MRPSSSGTLICRLSHGNPRLWAPLDIGGCSFCGFPAAGNGHRHVIDGFGSIPFTMTNLGEASRPAAARGVAQRWLPALLLLFIGSGCAALIYEVVWFQLLQLSIGSSSVSLGVLLGIFMGGMCLGSLLLPKYIDARRHPLKVYALLELGIGACGLVVLFLVPVIGNLYTKVA